MCAVCDEILLVWKMNSEKHAGNQDKYAGDMVLGIDLVVGAGLADGNAIHHMEVI